MQGDFEQSLFPGGPCSEVVSRSGLTVYMCVCVCTNSFFSISASIPKEITTSPQPTADSSTSPNIQTSSETQEKRTTASTTTTAAPSTITATTRVATTQEPSTERKTTPNPCTTTEESTTLGDTTKDTTIATPSTETTEMPTATTTIASLSTTTAAPPIAIVGNNHKTVIKLSSGASQQFTGSFQVSVDFKMAFDRVKEDVKAVLYGRHGQQPDFVDYDIMARTRNASAK